MSIISSFFQKRSLSPLQAWISDIGYGSLESDSGVAATQNSSKALPAVLACTSLIAETISTLPIGVFVKQGGIPVELDPGPAWLAQPVPNDPSMTVVTHFNQVINSLLYDGNAFIQAMPSVFDPQVLVVLDPSTVTIQRNAITGRIVYNVRSKAGQENTPYNSDQIVHIPRNPQPGAMRGQSPIEEARQAVGAAMAVQKSAARFFRNGATMNGTISTNAELTKAQADELRDKFTAAHTGDNAYKTGVLTGGATWTQLSVTPEQAQFLETRKNDVLEIARLFRVPPLLIQVNDPGAVSYASADAAVISFEKHTIRPIVRMLAMGYQRLIPQPNAYLNVNTKGFLQGDPETQMKIWVSEIENGLSNRDEIRALEEKPALPDGLGQKYTVPQRTIDLARIDDQSPPPFTPDVAAAEDTKTPPKPPMMGAKPNA